VACCGREDDGVTHGELAAWKDLTHGRTTARLFQGGSLYLLQERAALTAFIANHLTVLLGAMSRWMGTP
jgi:surfactin synthase thioesterase subunit